MKWVADQKQPAVAGVLLFAVTYTLGSAVSRIAFDFFNDNDLHLQLDDHLLRIAITEDRLHTSVYCSYKDKDGKWDKDDYDNSFLLHAKAGDDSVTATISALKDEEKFCWQNLKWWVRVSYGVDDGRLNKAAQDLFGLQENQLYLKGEDATLRLRQLHDQIMVLRGAAFNGLLAFSLCLFAWGAKFRRERPKLPAALRFRAGAAGVYVSGVHGHPSPPSRAGDSRSALYGIHPDTSQPCRGVAGVVASAAAGAAATRAARKGRRTTGGLTGKKSAGAC